MVKQTDEPEDAYALSDNPGIKKTSVEMNASFDPTNRRWTYKPGPTT